MTDQPAKPIALEDRDVAGARLSSPSAARNREAIAECLAERLPHGARVLEIASGTGEHALACVSRRPDLSWIPSDPDAVSRASTDDWARGAGGRMNPALALDVSTADWIKTVGPVDAVFCANMIHIAPWQAAEGLFSGAARLLDAGQRLHLYGPFLEGGRSAPSNIEFDQSLRGRDPAWGVRAIDAVDALAARSGFDRTERVQMPANNLLLSFERRAGQ